jgi:hypothetical protein
VFVAISLSLSLSISISLFLSRYVASARRLSFSV